MLSSAANLNCFCVSILMSMCVCVNGPTTGQVCSVQQGAEKAERRPGTLITRATGRDRMKFILEDSAR